MVLVQPLTELTTCLRLRDGDRDTRKQERDWWVIIKSRDMCVFHVFPLTLYAIAVTVKISHLAEDHHWNYKIKATFN